MRRDSLIAAPVVTGENAVDPANWEEKSGK
jgi:hypothetical protein